MPRYGAFAPDRLGNVYADEAALAEVSCQSCGQMFNVAMDRRFAGKGRGLCDEIRLGRLHYGDPPNTRCCDGGATMSSVTHRIVEYWARDHEIYSRWQRDSAFEGPVTQRCEPTDTVSEILAAAETGEAAIRVMCTSKPNRDDLAGRTAAAMASKGRVLIAFSSDLAVAARNILDGLVSKDAVGNVQQACSITFASFEQLPAVPPSTIDTIIILPGPALPPNTMMQRVYEELWHQTMSWLESATAGKVLIEFALAGRRRVIGTPDTVIDGWQMRAW